MTKLEAMCSSNLNKINHSVKIDNNKMIDLKLYGHHAGFSHFCYDARMCDYKIIKNNHSYCEYHEINKNGF